MRLRAMFAVVGWIVLGAATASSAVASAGAGRLNPEAPPPRPDVVAWGDAQYFGSTNPFTFSAPIVGMAATRTGRGYWLVARDGGIFTFGDARFFGSMGWAHLNAPIVGMAATRTGRGYWLVARDGGIFTFGDARFFGSMGGAHLNAPIVGMAGSPSDNGYWLAAHDGGVFTFGAAHFYGSIASIGQVVAIGARPSGDGYWLVETYGNTVPFGYAPRLFLGVGGLPQGVAGIATTRSGNGYWLVGRGTPGTLPGRVTITHAGASGGSGEIEVRWKAVPGATGYRVARAAAPTGPFEVAADVNLATGRTTAAAGVTNVFSNAQRFWPPSAVAPSPAHASSSFTYVEVAPRHYFRVTAYNANGDGAPSHVRCGAPIGSAAC